MTQNDPYQNLDPEVRHSVRMVIGDGICSQVMGVLTGGAFLVAFALMLGASNAVIGLIAAIPAIAQLAQLPAIFLVNRIRHRRAITVVAAFLGRLFLCSTIALPWLVPEPMRIPLLILALSLYFGLGAVGGCSFNSLMRDVIPESVMGTVFGRRLAIGTAVGAALSLVMGFGVDFAKAQFGDERIAYTILFGLGGAFGLVGVGFLSRVHDYPMTMSGTRRFWRLLGDPFRDPNYRNVLFFLGSWNAAVNMAAPFFVVYMVQRLEMSMGLVLSLSVLSQVVNVVFFRIWGTLADRYTNKSVLTVAGPLFVISFLMWPFTTMPERYFLTIPLLVLIHAFAGVSSAGVNLCTNNLALKAAPHGEATAFVAVNAIVSGVAAAITPILAGLAATWFSTKELSLTLAWTNLTDVDSAWNLPAVNLRGLDFMFLLAFVLGLYATHRLLAVQEAGEVTEEIVTEAFYGEVRKALTNVSNVAGLRHITYFPYAVLQYVKVTRRRGRPGQERDPDL